MRYTKWLCCIFALFVLTPLGRADDHANCSLDTIKGDYGFVSTVRAPLSKNQPERARLRFIGLISYDGAGNASVSGVTVTSGQTSSYVDSGVYKVDGAHCTGSVTFEKGKSKWAFVIVSGGSELLTIVQGIPDTTPFSQKKR
jgi:hypothetical protein